MEKIGLLAGLGRLPVECARAARSMGYSIFAVALLDGVDVELKQNVTDQVDISIAHLEKILKYFKDNEIKKVIMLGKVTKEMLFNGAHDKPDARMMKLIVSLPDRSDDTLMMVFVRELASEGLQAFDQTSLIRMLMPSRGTITKREPTPEERKDMEFGFRMAKEIGGLDIGQTAVVKNLAVMALEAIEGTDACIRRGGQLACGGAVVAKVAKPEQDVRFDVPTIGLKTIEAMVEVGATALVIEAGKTLVVEREKVIALAETNDITIVAM
ncbi:MAG: UDP-2,3-diacylglucosamine diphosphatase LpxI [Selenomonadaceae bacterium]